MISIGFLDSGRMIRGREKKNRTHGRYRCGRVLLWELNSLILLVPQNPANQLILVESRRWIFVSTPVMYMNFTGFGLIHPCQILANSWGRCFLAFFVGKDATKGDTWFQGHMVYLVNCHISPQLPKTLGVSTSMKKFNGRLAKRARAISQTSPGSLRPPTTWVDAIHQLFISLRLMPPAFAGLEIASSMARSTTKSSSNNSTILSIASSMARSTTKSNSNSSNNQQQQ